MLLGDDMVATFRILPSTLLRRDCACRDSGSPPPEEEKSPAREAVGAQRAGGRRGSAGLLPPPEDGAVRRAVHRNQSLRGLCQVRRRRLGLALLRQHGRPRRWVSRKMCRTCLLWVEYGLVFHVDMNLFILIYVHNIPMN